jgi:hypothetical protein
MSSGESQSPSSTSSIRRLLREESIEIEFGTGESSSGSTFQVSNRSETEEQEDLLPIATMSNTISIAGINCTVYEPDQVPTNPVTKLYPMTSRDNLDVDKRQTLLLKAAQASKVKYDRMDMTLNDPEKLADVYDLRMLITDTKTQFQMYDMDNIFTKCLVFKGKEEDNFDLTDVKEVDLFQHYNQVSVDDVAKSNRFYGTMLNNAKVTQYMCENLSTTFKYFQNSSTSNLYKKVMESYELYPDSSKGGPLFFKLMTYQIQSTNAEAANHLIARLKKMKITDYDGEDVSLVVSHIRAAVQRLAQLKDEDNKSRLPTDIQTRVLKILQTSSNSDFNSLFAQYENSVLLRTLDPQATNTSPTQESVYKILTLAENKYVDLLDDPNSDWHGLKKSKASTFIAKCHNCDDPNHKLHECKKPKDQARIEASIKALKDSKTSQGRGGGRGSGRGGPGRGRGHNGNKDGPRLNFSPPTDTEKNNKNRRVMADGKTWFYHFKNKRWVKLRNQPGDTPSQQPSGATAQTDNTTNHQQQTATQDLPTTGHQQANSTITPNLVNKIRVLKSLFETLE